MIDHTAGTTELVITHEGEQASFQYMGYFVIVDTVNVHINKGRDTFAIKHNAGKRDTVYDRISKAKDIVLGEVDKEREEELRNKHWRTYDKLEEADGRNQYDIECYAYRGHRITITQSNFYEDCPWDDWDAEPTAYTLESFGGTLRYAYGKNEDSYSGSLYNNGYETEVWLRYFRLIGAVADDFHTRSQGYIAVFTKEEVQEHFLGDYNLAKSALKNSIKAFQAWAEGEVYNWNVEDGNGEHIEGVGGYYGSDGIPYMLEEAINSVDIEANEIEAEQRDMAAEERSMIEAELGPMSTLFA